ncbi:hypothetical protein E2C01_056998 [Portunus trituberculatus]|uniref:Uncharacterized protein n=1 Tax=Portunus trituberculatus TaxID=210409 RepID=A0A5B7GZ75_PORTR|nr:hypothetical protein [Portunus trituberculatus]
MIQSFVNVGSISEDLVVDCCYDWHGEWWLSPIDHHGIPNSSLQSNAEFCQAQWILELAEMPSWQSLVETLGVSGSTPEYSNGKDGRSLH